MIYNDNFKGEKRKTYANEKKILGPVIIHAIVYLFHHITEERKSQNTI